MGMISIKIWNDQRKYLANFNNHKIFDALKSYNVDFRILNIHGGTERSRIPDPAVVELSRKFIADYEGDLVLGHHPHVVSGLEVFRKKNGRLSLIVYSIGNGLHNGINGLNGDGMVFKTVLNQTHGATSISLHPLRSNAYKIKPISSKRLIYFQTQINNASKLVSPVKNPSLTKLQFSLSHISKPTPGLAVQADYNEK